MTYSNFYMPHYSNTLLTQPLELWDFCTSSFLRCVCGGEGRRGDVATRSNLVIPLVQQFSGHRILYFVSNSIIYAQEGYYFIQHSITIYQSQVISDPKQTNPINYQFN